VNESLPCFLLLDLSEGFVSRKLEGAGGLAEFLVLGMRLGLLFVFGAALFLPQDHT